MFGDHFYHAVVRKSVAIFGTMFNNISVVRRDATGQPLNQVKVPLAYGPRQKFLARLDSAGNDETMAIKMPRIAFEMVGIDYDTENKTNKYNRISQNADGSTGHTLAKDRISLQTPYNIQMEMSILAKNQDDGLQILEQILPYFQPEYSVTVLPIDGWSDYKQDIPIVLKDVTVADDYEGETSTRRVLIYTLTFEMKMKFYGPSTNTGIIRDIDVNFLDFDDSTFLERMNIYLDPLDSSPGSDYDIVTAIDLSSYPETIILTVADTTGFTVGDVVVGLTSGTGGTVQAIGTDSPDTITVNSLDGYFYAAETLSDTTASPDITTTITSWIEV
jgi:hypothetical protein